MEFPATPRTLIARLRDQADPLRWQETWQEFFDLYHAVILVCVRGSLSRKGWTQVPAHDVEDIVVTLMQDLYAPGAEQIDVQNYRFRQMLRMLAHRRTVDFIRRQQKRRLEVGGDAALGVAAQNLAAMQNVGEESPEEAEAFQQAALITLLDTLRKEVSFQVFLIFDLVKFKGQSPEQVAEELGVKRGVVDNGVYKAMQKLKEIAQRPELKQEFSNE